MLHLWRAVVRREKNNDRLFIYMLVPESSQICCITCKKSSKERCAEFLHWTLDLEPQRQKYSPMYANNSSDAMEQQNAGCQRCIVIMDFHGSTCEVLQPTTCTNYNRTSFIAFLGRSIDHFGKCACVKHSNSNFEYQPSLVLTSTSSLEIVAVYFSSAYI